MNSVHVFQSLFIPNNPQDGPDESEICMSVVVVVVVVQSVGFSSQIILILNVFF